MTHGVPEATGPLRVAQVVLGSELRRLREDRGLSQERLGELVFCSGAYVGQIEAATRRPQEDMSERFDSVLETGGHFARLYPPVTRTRFAEYFTAAAELQAVALTISEYAPVLVPGLLQTPEYARALFRSAQPLRSAAETDDLVSLRMDRARLLEGPTSPMLRVVLDESAIRRPIGGAATMAGQLSHLAALMREHRIIVQVLPYSAGARALLEGALSLMTFADAPPVAYLEGPHAGQLVDDPSTVAKCLLSYDFVRAAALSPEASLPLIESAAEEHAHGQE
ncbi:helix-turn-helix protein [Kitasatospora cineracea]|uniref:Helix-turn-helix protein n=1 Tax=Kitasatospora cineracea TaxID=88074 RepID=A0A8G1UJC4_9ACTN|nr:helix-turn-helix protein [Kitasatospora cineracea]